jgi:hypothetical protein
MTSGVHPLAPRKSAPVGTVYLLHFARPYYHARHYIGFSTCIERRMREHRSGHGSPLVAAVFESGLEIFVARRWENVTRAFERRMHRTSHNGRRGCPICHGPQAYRRWLPRRDPDTGIGV